MMILRFALLIIVIVACEGVLEENGVAVLDTYNFDYNVRTKKILLVLFYSYGYGDRCREAIAAHEEAALILANQSMPGVLAKLDGMKATDIVSKYEAFRYPAYKLFRNGSWEVDYKGPVTSAAIVNFMTERSRTDYKPPSDAVILTDDNFYNFVHKNDFVLVYFHRPECTLCQKFQPEFVKAAKTLIHEKPPIYVGSVDINEEVELGIEYNISRVPLLMTFRYGRPTIYEGERSERKIQFYMVRHRRNSIMKLDSLSEFWDTFERDKPHVVGYFPGPVKRFRLNFIDAMDSLRDIVRAFITESSEIAAELGMKRPAFSVFSSADYHSEYEPRFKVCTEVESKVEDIKQFVRDSMPLVGEWNYYTKRLYLAQRNKTVCVAFYHVDFSHEFLQTTQKWRMRLMTFALEFREQVLFAIADDENDALTNKQDFGLGDMSTSLGFSCLTQQYAYPMPETDTFNSHAVRSFIIQVLKGRARPYLRSEAKTRREPDALVQTVVGNSFSEIVLEKNFETLLLAHTHACESCILMSNILVDAAQLFENIITMQFARIDVGKNDPPPNFRVDHVPMFYFQPGNLGPNHKLDSNVTLENLITFMKKHTVYHLREIEAVEAKLTNKEGKKKRDEL